MKKLLARALLSLLLPTPLALGYTQTLTPSGAPVRWRAGQTKLNLAGNPTNRSGLSDQDVYAAAVRSLQRWKQASGGAVGFDYWQGRSAAYEANNSYNGLSSFYFASGGGATTGLSASVLGLTQVWYNTSTGEILETDVVLNDRDFQFTTNPTDTSGYGSGLTAGYGASRKVFIENVLTHELGHAYGLSHSGGLQSTMLFMEAPEQAHLSCDEQVGIRGIYSSAATASRGAISGQVIAESGAPVFGAQVTAISRRRGTVLGGAVTDANGRYVIRGLEAGEYFLLAEPFYAGNASLPGYYAKASAALCSGGQYYGRTPLLAADGAHLQGVAVAGGAAAAAPTLKVLCSNTSGASIAAGPGSTGLASAPTVYAGASGGFGLTDRFATSSALDYRISFGGGDLELHALGFSLYSPVGPRLRLLDAGGNAVAAQVDAPAFASETGYVNFDSALRATNLAAGDYYIEVTGATVEYTRYPAASVSLDHVPFFVLTGAFNEGAPAAAGELPVNTRCRATENFAAYAIPAGDPARRDADDDGDGGGIGFCGMIERAGGSSSSGPFGGGSGGGASGPSGGALAGWILPWALMLAAARLAKRLAPRGAWG